MANRSQSLIANVQNKHTMPFSFIYQFEKCKHFFIYFSLLLKRVPQAHRKWNDEECENVWNFNWMNTIYGTHQQKPHQKPFLWITNGNNITPIHFIHPMHTGKFIRWWDIKGNKERTASIFIKICLSSSQFSDAKKKGEKKNDWNRQLIHFQYQLTFGRFSLA